MPRRRNWAWSGIPSTPSLFFASPAGPRMGRLIHEEEDHEPECDREDEEGEEDEECVLTTPHVVARRNLAG